MAMPRLPALSLLLGGLALASCAHTLDEASNDDPYGGAQVMAGATGIVRLPAEWDAQRLLTTRQVNDGVLTEEIILANATNAPRENRLRVQTRWRGAGTLYGFAKDMESPFTSQAIEERLAAEFMSAAPDLEPIQRRNRHGPYMYVQTRMGDADTCIYAWQMTDAVSELRAETHLFAVDLRLCQPTDDPDQLLALFDSIELAPRL
jgi:hypothetical protein